MSSEPPAYGRSARERRTHAKYVYPGTDVLRNLQDLRDAAELEQFERFAVATAAKHRERLQVFTYDSFKDLHRTLFTDVYEWAGQIRDYSTGRGTAPFCLPEFIDANMERIFAQLAARDDLKNLTADEFADRAGEFINDINAVHPFIEGNGRTNREFLRDLAACARHPINLSRFNRDTWYAAAARGFEAARQRAHVRLHTGGAQLRLGVSGSIANAIIPSLVVGMISPREGGSCCAAGVWRRSGYRTGPVFGERGFT